MTDRSTLIIDHHLSPPPDAVIEHLATIQDRAYSPVGLRGWKASDIASLVASPVGQLLVARHENGGLCGFLLANVIDDEGEILSLAVDPAYQRQNIARLLVNKLVMDQQKIKMNRLVLEVADTNRIAIAFYENLRFSTVGIRRNYYLVGINRIDARLMERVYNCD